MAFLARGFRAGCETGCSATCGIVPYAYYKNVQTGDLVQRCTSDGDGAPLCADAAGAGGHGVHGRDGLCHHAAHQRQNDGAFLVLLPFAYRGQLCIFPPRAGPVFKGRPGRGASFPPSYRKTSPACAWCAPLRPSARSCIFTQKNETFRRTITHLNTLMGMFWGATDTLAICNCPQPVLRRVVCRKRRADAWAGDAVFHPHPPCSPSPCATWLLAAWQAEAPDAPGGYFVHARGGRARRAPFARH